MEDQQNMLENTNSEYITLSFADRSLVSHTEQLSKECADIILGPDNCQNFNDINPLNDLLLGQTFLIENNEQPLFDDNTEITFQHIDPNEQIDDIQTISNPLNTDDDFQEIYTDFDLTNSDLMKTTNDSNNLKEHLQVKINTDITSGNYSNSTAIKILDDVAKSPINTNGHFVCDLCLYEFFNWKNYKRHKLEHLNDKPFKCLKCLKSFNYNNNYLLHIASHSTSNLKCPKCKKEFKRIASFKCHLNIHKTEESITCNICDKIFYNQYRLDIHKKNCMQENIINPGEGTSVSSNKTCSICNKSLPTLLEYKMHLKEHKKFDSVLKKHMASSKLKRLQKNANKIKKFKCVDCDWSFNKSNLLVRHMRTHTGERPFKCPHCLTYFTQQNSLNRHLLKHIGIRPFNCEFCEMSFCQKGHLINHMKRCHAVTNEATRIHKCTMCTCVYNSINSLSKHLNNYHGLKYKNLVHENVEDHDTNSNETDDIGENVNLIKDSSKLEKWLEEVANELESGDNNTELKDRNVPTSTQCEFGLNELENENYDDILSPISSLKTSDQFDIENLTYTLEEGEHFLSIENEPISLNVAKETTTKLPMRKEKSDDKISKSDAKKTLQEKKNEHTLNSKKRNSVSNVAKRNTNHTSSKAEPKDLYVPNIVTNSKERTNSITPKPLPKVCPFCDKVFKKNADLDRHRRTHTGDRPYRCSKVGCSKAFATKSSLEYHTITHVGQMKRAECPECNGLFATTTTLKVHMRQHTGEKPFKCPVCGDAFRTSGHLHTHVVIHGRKKKPK